MEIEQNVVFIHPITDKLKKLLDHLEARGDEFIIYEMESVAEFVQLIGIMDFSITFSSDLAKTEEYLKKTSTYVKAVSCHNCAVFDKNYPPHLTKKLRLAGINQIYQEDELNLSDLESYIDEFFEKCKTDDLESFVKSEDLGIGAAAQNKQVGEEAVKVQEKPEAGTIGEKEQKDYKRRVIENNFQPKSLFDNLKLKKSVLGNQFLGSPFDNIKRKKVQQFDSVQKKLKKKQFSFKEVERPLKKRKQMRFEPVERKRKNKKPFAPITPAFNQRKTKKFEPAERNNQKKKKPFIPATSGFNQRKSKDFKPVERKAKPKKLFKPVDRKLNRRKAQFQAVERELTRKELDPKKKKELEKLRKKLAEKNQNHEKHQKKRKELEHLLEREMQKQKEKGAKDLDPEQEGLIKNLMQDLMDDIDKDEADIDLLFEELNLKTIGLEDDFDEQKEQQGIDLDAEERKKQKGGYDLQQIKKEYDLTDYESFTTKKKAGELQLEEAIEEAVAADLYEEELLEEETPYYYPQTLGLEYLLIYNDMLSYENVGTQHLCKLIQFAYKKEFDAPLSLYLVHPSGADKYEPVFEGHMEPNSFYEAEEFESYKHQSFGRWREIKIPTFQDETFQSDKNEFVYPYFKEEKLLGFSIVHLHPLKGNHQDAKKIELLSLALVGVIIDEFYGQKEAA